MALGIGNSNGRDIGMPPESSAARAMRAAEQALRLAPGNSEAWTAMGVARLAADQRHHAGVRQAFERAIALDSTNAEAHHLLGFTLAVMGLDSLGLVHDRHALAINPSRPVTLQHLFQEALVHGRIADARFWLDSIFKVAPDFQPTVAGSIPLLILEGDTARGRQLYGALPAPRGRLPASRVGYYAGAAALLGDFDGAMAWLEAAQPRGLFLHYFMRMPMFDAMRAEPRFARLFRELSPS
jgi:tetratricopeptide (TPR) repeat protein